MSNSGSQVVANMFIMCLSEPQPGKFAFMHLRGRGVGGGDLTFFLASAPGKFDTGIPFSFSKYMSILIVAWPETCSTHV